MIRNDFVSNSSSSSFFIVGYYIHVYDFKEKMKIDPYDVTDWVEEFLDKNDVHLQYKFDYDNEILYFGLGYKEMLSDETKSEFEYRIKCLVHNTFKDLFKDKEIDSYCEVLEG